MGDGPLNSPSRLLWKSGGAAKGIHVDQFGFHMHHHMDFQDHFGARYVGTTHGALIIQVL